MTEFRIADTGREKPRNDFCVIALSEISAFARAVPPPPMGRKSPLAFGARAAYGEKPRRRRNAPGPENWGNDRL